MQPSDRPVTNSGGSDPGASEVSTCPYQRAATVEITPDMEWAGFLALSSFESEAGDPKETARKVYLSMEAARRGVPLASLDQSLARESAQLSSLRRPGS